MVTIGKILRSEPDNCGYFILDEVKHWVTGEWSYIPRVPEEGYAVAHLLDVEQLGRACTVECGVMLLSAPGVHEWHDNAKFVAIPEGASYSDGVAESPDPYTAVRKHWEHFAEAAGLGTVPVMPYRLEHVGGEWFTRYPKTGESMDDGDVEFHVRSVERVGSDGTFTVDELFFLRYKLAEIKKIMPREANAYDIVDVSVPDAQGLTTVTARFYHADVDLTRRLPRADVIARDYDRLMEVYAH